MAVYSFRPSSDILNLPLWIMLLIFFLSKHTTGMRPYDEDDFLYIDVYVKKGNFFVDELISKIKTDRNSVYSLDPLNVPDIKASYFETKNVVVKGMAKLKRDGPCLRESPNSDFAVLTCRMSATNLTVDFNYSANALLFWFSGDGRMEVDELTVDMQISFQTDNANLDIVEIVNLGKFHVVKMNGLTVLLNWMLKMIAQSVFNRAEESIKESVTRTTTKALRDIMKNV